jgi:indole-3-glycerol phosphate synthase
MLEQIISQKKNRLKKINQREKIRAWEKELDQMPEAKNFRQALLKEPELALIAEIKRASPSAGLLSERIEVGKMASIYEQAGASCISVLTEEDFFLGSSDDLRLVKGASQLPVLRKDFIFTDYQIWESKMIGADCLLLILAILPTAELKRLSGLAKELGLQALVEVHTEKELDRALEAGSQIIGINNRDLKTMTVDLKTVERLIPLIPDGIATVAESGISSRADILALQELGVDAALVGEAIIMSPDPGSKIRELLGQRIKTEVSG